MESKEFITVACDPIELFAELFVRSWMSSSQVANLQLRNWSTSPTGRPVHWSTSPTGRPVGWATGSSFPSCKFTSWEGNASCSQVANLQLGKVMQGDPKLQI